MSNTEITKPWRFLRVRQAVEAYPFSEGSLRWLIFNRKFNGFEKVLIRVGRKILLDEEKLVEWLRKGSQS